VCQRRDTGLDRALHLIHALGMRDDGEPALARRGDDGREYLVGGDRARVRVHRHLDHRGAGVGLRIDGRAGTTGDTGVG
jgi:hypothetical protein